MRSGKIGVVIPTFAIVPTYNRHAIVSALVSVLAADTHVIVIDNMSSPPLMIDSGGHGVSVVRHTVKPPRLYEMWSVGLRLARQLASEQASDHAYNVAILNDDAVVDSGWVRRLTQHLRDHPTAVIAATYAHKRGTAVELRTQPSRTLSDRMCPWAFVARGETLPEPDTDFHWWWGDTDLEWRACHVGGVLLVPGEPPSNALANTTTVGALAQRAGIDGEVFMRKWGERPW